MNIRLLARLCSLIFCVCVLRADETVEARATDDNDPLLVEDRYVSSVVDSLKGKKSDISESLFKGKGTKGHQYESDEASLIGFRAYSICATLRNGNEHGKAFDVAKVAVKMLDKIAKKTNEAEASYWQAQLLADFMDEPKKALQLVEKARKLAPNDDRLLELEYEYLRVVEGKNLNEGK